MAKPNYSQQKKQREQAQRQKQQKLQRKADKKNPPPNPLAALPPVKPPLGLIPLIEDGVIDEVIRSLKSGKEATVYLVRSGTQSRCAKVYRDKPIAALRSVRNTRRGARCAAAARPAP